jgi:hypothetical protein
MLRLAAIRRPEDSIVEGYGLEIYTVSSPFFRQALRRAGEEVNIIRPYLRSEAKMRSEDAIIA